MKITFTEMKGINSRGDESNTAIWNLRKDKIPNQISKKNLRKKMR